MAYQHAGRTQRALGVEWHRAANAAVGALGRGLAYLMGDRQGQGLRLLEEAAGKPRPGI